MLRYEDPSIPGKDVENVRKLCDDRINVSYYKYGPAKKNFAEGRVDAVASADLNLEKYRKTKNLEYLLDAINYLTYAFIFPLPGYELKPTDSSGSAGTVGTPINMEE